MTRMICWFSCGAASACAAKLALKYYSQEYDVQIVNCDTRPNEHPDNYRFSAEVEQWLGKPITYIRSKLYNTIEEVFERTGYMSGPHGARCTTELKKVPRMEFATPDDIHVFGFTSEEQKRISEFESRNPELQLRWPLIFNGYTKERCIYELNRAGIAIPIMYQLGFRNNNCIGCVKASSPWYWDRIRSNFPDVFARRCEQSRRIGCRLVEIHHHERIFLGELPPGPFRPPRKRENLSCGPECGGPPQLR